MKKKIYLVIMLMALILLPNLVNAKEKEPINIYLFRGQGCGFCQKFLNYVNDTLSSKYDGKFNLVSYEVWYDTNNASLMNDVRSFLKSDGTGVPFVVIGDKYFEGYTESYNSEMENAIQTLYDSDDRYDVFEEMKKDGKDIDLSEYNDKEMSEVFEEESITEKESANVSSSGENSYASSNSNTVTIVLWNLFFIAIGVTIILVVQYVNKKAILEEINKKIK